MKIKVKKLRHSKIIELINTNPIETQEEMQSALLNHGFDVTQATVSRDIKQLGLVKAQDSSGRYRYVTAHSESYNETDFLILISSIISIDYAINNVVIKCHTGMAQAACAKLDSMGMKNILGTLAGEDTILIITRSEADSANLCEELHSIIKKR